MYNDTDTALRERLDNKHPIPRLATPDLLPSPPQKFIDDDGFQWIRTSSTSAKPYQVFPPGENPQTSRHFKAHTTDEAKRAHHRAGRAKRPQLAPTAPAWMSASINEDAQRLSKVEIPDLRKQERLFIVRTGNQWIEEAKARPIPRMLFDALWFEGEICILFAGSNQGKSILAVQIADSISRGVPVRGFRLEAERQVVLYFDFELSDKQFETRYSDNYTGHYVFDEYFLRVEINSDAAPSASGPAFDELIIRSIEEAVLQHGAKVLIIDNLTFLRSTEAENAKEASPLMKQLKALKKKHGLSLLILAHTPKRDQSRPLTQNDLQGSSRLMQFADSAFAIGASARDNGTKYLKQIKVRNTGFVFDSDNVAVMQIDKPGNFLQLDLIRYDTEQEHLKADTGKDTATRKDKAQELKAKGLNNSEIARELGISEGAVRKYFKA